MFLHTASDQKLDSGKAWERGYPKAALISRESENEASVCICYKHVKSTTTVGYIHHVIGLMSQMCTLDRAISSL